MTRHEYLLLWRAAHEIEYFASKPRLRTSDKDEILLRAQGIKSKVEEVIGPQSFMDVYLSLSHLPTEKKESAK